MGSQANIQPAFSNDVYTARYLWQDMHQRFSYTSFQCPALMPVKRQFNSGSIYKETDCGCEIDPAKQAQYQEELSELRGYIKTLVTLSDRYIATPTEQGDITQCIMQHITHWAENDAMLGQHRNDIGYHKTAELLGAVATSYLKIRHSRDIKTIHHEDTIGDWMKRAASHVQHFYTDKAGNQTLRNNHRYWDSFHLGRASVALQDKYLFQWAMDGLTIGLSQIDENGALPLEGARGNRAFSYHLYATMALVGLAELAVVNREYMVNPYYPYEENNSALRRLIWTIRANAKRNSKVPLFADARPMKCHEAAWLEMYSARALVKYKYSINKEVVAMRRACNGKLYNTLLGGNVSLTYGKPI
ncbi:alginate lyase family protein [Aestuariibacter sp. AA17]|uniref:Alginate lyase family protein n=1 Tax=Fluctibacter corallii TaxID=2984329 RepID=A0ABT3A9F0_9ALTE|nr:alginate lyase family protein [Aestuariibacter sp. AA17]MCV2884902.1 alginate lyase family protein [Aestuariibacter sp. AA17]